ncbi:MAG: transcription termination/antitermination protein NusA [Evtepia gabavorous]
MEIRSIAREAGSRSKLAVWSADENVDPIGACVGPKGARVNNVVAELGSEKIDIIKYSDDPAEYVAASSPRRRGLRPPLEGTKSCRVVVPDDQLSLAIGKEGQNARLAAKLTGYKIDIKAASAAHEWEEEDAEAQRAAQEAAEAAGLEEEFQSPEETAPETPPRPPARSHPRDRQRELTVHTTYKEVAPCQKIPCANASAAGK